MKKKSQKPLFLLSLFRPKPITTIIIHFNHPSPNNPSTSHIQEESKVKDVKTQHFHLIILEF
jgi:hypothetical protein